MEEEKIEEKVEKETRVETPQEKLVRLKQKVTSPGLYIMRIPEKTKLEFMAWAKSDFSKDYGMALKWLWDTHKGLLVTPNEELLARIDLLAIKLVELENKMSAISSTPLGRRVIRNLAGGYIRGSPRTGRTGGDKNVETDTNTSKEKEVPNQTG